jgi:hypothetical protein
MEMIVKTVATAAATLVTLAGLASGCAMDFSANDGEERARAQPATEAGHGRPQVTAQGKETLHMVRDGLDHYVFASPGELVEQSAVVIVGTVDGVVPGRSVVSKADGTITRTNTVVVRVEVDRQVKTTGNGTGDRGMAFVSLPRGINDLTPDGSIVGVDPNPSVDDLQKAIPAGTRVMVASQPYDLELQSASEKVVSDPNPPPKGGVLLQGLHPQMLVFDEGDQELEAWPGLTFDELLAAVQG